jgi:EF hand
MKQFLAGGLAATALLASGLWLWQSWAGQEIPIPAPPPPAISDTDNTDVLPVAGPGAPKYGAKPPTPVEAPKASREEVRFNRYDRNRDEIITRIEMLSSRTKAFKKLDKDSNNLLTFEEWAAATSERFGKADSNRNGQLNRTEFAATRPKNTGKPACRC